MARHRKEFSRVSSPRSFDDVFAADGIQVITTPIQAPNANAFAGRWVRTVREECLDWVLVWGRRHLEWVLAEGVTVSLRRCDGGEEIERITSDDPALLAFLGERTTSQE